MQSRVRVGKKGIRALGVAESFRKRLGSRAVLAGVVMRSDLLVDGFVFGACTVGGMDSTEAVLEMWQRLGRMDINVVLLSGSVISWFNVVDLNKLHQTIGTPLICLSYRDSRGLEEVFRRRFPSDWEQRLSVHLRNGERSDVVLKTGYKVYVRCFGLLPTDAKTVLDKFTVDGRFPEPVRLAKLLARGALNYLEPFLGSESGFADVGRETT
ncbi:conserved hypothetical protein [Candidatus Caldarchaeum subterraneum]|uniref:UPF0215 protein CSUB_C1498 n=1 Tax=Caldiarchaeum subterraneum TaxID=311458 RepID=E6N8M5_CALS0|nr:conserved hypothetical protein [Candidatus Caldarchaeum subterraneum]BAJ51349.1 conserved hypothetical protein [Candidatus Caldarchaeum subterraneum]